MANFNRWFNYAKAKFEATFAEGNRELDELEAERAAEVADKPWLSATGEAPSFDEAKARIEWEAEEAARRARASGDGGSRAPSAGDGAVSGSVGPMNRDGGPVTPSAGTSGEGSSTSAAPGPVGDQAVGNPITSPEERAAAAEAASAQLEMEARQKESAARLDAIRAELGIDPPADQPTSEG